MLNIRRTVTPPIVPADCVSVLGKIGDHEYVSHKGTEFLLDGSELDSPEDVAHREGAIFVSVPVYVKDGGRQLEVGRKYRRGLPLPAGSFDLERETAARRERRVQPKPKLVDALDLPALASRPDRVIPTPGKVPAYGLWPSLRSTPSGHAAGQRKIRGRDLLPFLEFKAVGLAVHEGRLLITADNGRLTAGIREVIERAEPLLVGWLSGHPVPCELDHGKDTEPEAVTILLGGLAACQSHLDGGDR